MRSPLSCQLTANQPSSVAFSLLEAIVALVMLPSIVMLLQAGGPFGHFWYH